MQAHYQRYTLHFKRPSGTSRGVLVEKETWFIHLQDGHRTGIGECCTLKGLSVDDRPDFEEQLQRVCNDIDNHAYWLNEGLREFPALHFGLEMALKDLEGERHILFPSDFTTGQSAIPINGLVWMGEASFMQAQIRAKLEQGFNCIKLKIGAIDFDQELHLLRKIRQEYSASDIELRVDANGAFAPEEAREKLERLAALDLHSIEQPIKPQQWEAMAQLCENTPLPIALDEELIGVFDDASKQKVLDTIQPQYIILKPSLVGGFKGSGTWMALANERNIPWWITSALESNIGLNAIAQWTYTLNNPMPQGLGTGQLFTNNLPSPLEVHNGALHYRPELVWNLNALQA